MSMPDNIPAPALAPGRRGLLAVATSPPLGGASWLQGLAFQPESCAVADPLPWVLCGTPDDMGDPDDRPDPAEFQPILLRGMDTCSTLDGIRLEERSARARTNLAATASFQAERELELAAASDLSGTPNWHLADTDADDVTSAPEAPAVALALLEQGLAQCLHGARGMIHAAPLLVSLWDAAGQIHIEGGLLVTANDNLVVAGSGYTGAEPDGTPPAAGSMWAYGTGLVYQQRGGPEVEGPTVADRMDREQNSITTWAMEPLLLWASTCCKVAAEVDITSP